MKGPKDLCCSASVNQSCCGVVNLYFLSRLHPHLPVSESDHRTDPQKRHRLVDIEDNQFLESLDPFCESGSSIS
jgi:hypothetical protein